MPPFFLERILHFSPMQAGAIGDIFTQFSARLRLCGFFANLLFAVAKRNGSVEGASRRFLQGGQFLDQTERYFFDESKQEHVDAEQTQQLHKHSFHIHSPFPKFEAENRGAFCARNKSERDRFRPLLSVAGGIITQIFHLSRGYCHLFCVFVKKIFRGKNTRIWRKKRVKKT